MTALIRQHARYLLAHAGGDLARSRLGLVTGMGMTPDLRPLRSVRARLLVRSAVNSITLNPDNVVGMALVKTGTIATASGVNLTSSQITEATDYWADHELVITSGGQQGEARKVAASGSGSLTLARAFDSDPGAGDGFEILPQRVTSRPWIGHAADSFYYYAVCELSPLGIRGPLSRAVRVEFDGGGALRTPAPNSVRALHAKQLASGKFRLRWLYPARGQGGYPKDFRVFGDGGSGTVDYNTPLTDSETGLTSVAYRRHGAVYTFTTPAYADGLAVKFAVVARNSGDVEQLGGGTVSTALEAMSTPPSSPPKIRSVNPSARP